MEGRCPECNRAYDISDEFLSMGGRAKCPHCLLELEFPPTPEQIAQQDESRYREVTKPDPNRKLPARPAVSSELDSHCESCGRKYKIDREYLEMGGKSQCPHCAVDLVFDSPFEQPTGSDFGDVGEDIAEDVWDDA